MKYWNTDRRVQENKNEKKYIKLYQITIKECDKTKINGQCEEIENLEKRCIRRIYNAIR